MANRSDIRITQTDKQFTILRKDVSGATPPTGPFTNLDAAATRVDPIDDIALWANTTEMFYFGNATPWTILGFLPGTITPSHTNFVREYWNGSAWTTLTLLNDSTILFNKAGYIVWSIPGDWSLITVDGASAYFVRVQSTGVTTAGRAQHFLPLVESKPPVKLLPIHLGEESRVTNDVNGVLRDRDVPIADVIGLEAECTTNAFNFAEIHLLQEFIDKRRKLRIDDIASTSPIAWNIDSHYRYYEGKLASTIGRKLAQKKMDGDDYTLIFSVDNAVSLFDLLGVT